MVEKSLNLMLLKNYRVVIQEICFEQIQIKIVKEIVQLRF